MKLLENEKIRLRALEPEDLEHLYRWENDTSIWRYGCTMTPYSRFTLKLYLSAAQQDIYQVRQLRMIIVLKATGDVAGTIDLYDFDPANSRAALGIIIDERCRHQGIGAEAIALTQDYAFRFLLLRQLYAFVPERNIPSVKLFTASGFRTAGKLTAWIKNETGFEDVFLMQSFSQSPVIQP